jgi:hypothetical protein
LQPNRRAGTEAAASRTADQFRSCDWQKRGAIGENAPGEWRKRDAIHKNTVDWRKHGSNGARLDQHFARRGAHAGA